jgi:hypothetical protein
VVLLKVEVDCTTESVESIQDERQDSLLGMPSASRVSNILDSEEFRRVPSFKRNYIMPIICFYLEGLIRTRSTQCRPELLTSSRAPGPP